MFAKNESLIMVLFLLGFIVHNIEEGIWLPEWSKYAREFHPPVERGAFLFADIVITAAGILITFFELANRGSSVFINGVYTGFVGMMVVNAIFPHLIATIAVKRYAPGLITGFLLNFIIGGYLIYKFIRNGTPVGFVILSTLVLFGFSNSNKILFAIGKKLAGELNGTR